MLSELVSVVSSVPFSLKTTCRPRESQNCVSLNVTNCKPPTLALPPESSVSLLSFQVSSSLPLAVSFSWVLSLPEVVVMPSQGVMLVIDSLS